MRATSKGGTVVHVRLGVCTFALTRLEAELLDMTRRAGGGMFVTKAQTRRAEKLASLGFGQLKDAVTKRPARYFELNALAMGGSSS